MLYLQYGILDTAMNSVMKIDKILLFEYLIYCLIEWYKDAVSNNEHLNKHFTRLTALKLLFFVSTIKDTENKNKDLLDIFSNYCAMQYGPVEIDIYAAIVDGKTQLYKFGVHGLIVNSENNTIFDSLNLQDKSRIDRAIMLLKNRNPKIISYPASILIDISHKWEAWQNAMSLASMLGKRCENMPTNSIRENRQFYE